MDLGAHASLALADTSGHSPIRTDFLPSGLWQASRNSVSHGAGLKHYDRRVSFVQTWKATCFAALRNCRPRQFSQVCRYVLHPQSPLTIVWLSISSYTTSPYRCNRLNPTIGLFELSSMLPTEQITSRQKEQREKEKDCGQNHTVSRSHKNTHIVLDLTLIHWSDPSLHSLLSPVAKLWHWSLLNVTQAIWVLFIQPLFALILLIYKLNENINCQV